jgi:filamentous hemagglutinin
MLSKFDPVSAGADSNLTIQGSNIEAGRAVQLLADNQVKLLAAQNTASENSTNSNSSGSIGISYGTDGLLFNASASGGKGRGDGADTFYTNTQVKAGDQVSITSGGDTTLQGAVVKANQVKADVGGNLNITSLQDTSTYTSSQKSMGGSISVGWGKMSGSVNASKSNIDSNFNSVGEQTGIKAGSGGFQVSVAGNTALLGSVIASDTQAC